MCESFWDEEIPEAVNGCLWTRGFTRETREARSAETGGARKGGDGNRPAVREHGFFWRNWKRAGTKRTKHARQSFKAN